MDRPTRVFRTSFPHLWKWTSIYCGLLGSMYCFLEWQSDRPIPFGMSGSISLAVGFVFAVTSLLFPVYVGEDGIRCFGFFGFYSTIPWDDFGPILDQGVLGLRYFRIINSTARYEIWIPRFLWNRVEFIETVRDYAGEDHPLSRALES